MGFIKYIMQCVHGWFAVEGVPVLLCTILHGLQLGTGAVGNLSASKVFLSSFQMLLKHTNLYTCNIIIHLFGFFLDLFLPWKKAV